MFHFKNNGPEFEGSIDHSATHVKWQVSSLSPVGPVLQNHDPVYYHGVVILYKAVNDHPSLSFRVYVASNNDSFIKVRSTCLLTMLLNIQTQILSLFVSCVLFCFIPEVGGLLTPEKFWHEDLPWGRWEVKLCGSGGRAACARNGACMWPEG